MKLNKYQFGWIIAAKNNEMVEYYKETHPYVRDDFEPQIELLGYITKGILFDLNQLERAMRLFELDYNIYKMLYNKQTFTLNEIYYFAFVCWATYVTMEELDSWINEESKKNNSEKG